MTIQWKVEGGIGLLTLNQPPSNTMTLDFFSALNELVLEIKSSTNLSAVIIQGNGRHYSSGADINEMLQHVDEQIMVKNYRSFTLIEELDIPVISAIRGVCLGSAFELALFSHFRICSTDAVLGLPESTFNLMPGIGGIQRVARLAGNATAIEISLRGNTFTASDAFAMGLVDVVVPKGKVLSMAFDFARLLPEKIIKEHRAAYIHKFLNPLNASS
jgi:enoyl-CoA hydratase/carnithine racemase